jgi:probable HAF family extracellular repeat protein
MNPRKALCLVVVFLLACAPLAVAQGTYTQIDVPGSQQTEAYGIDTAGDIVGFYEDTSLNIHGFLLSGGAYTTIDYPGTQYTYLYGLNDFGQIVGNAVNPDIGFMHDVQAQTFTTISYPHAYQTFPFKINNAGTIVGSVNYGNESPGFELVRSIYREILPPGAVPDLFVTGITAAGKIVGTILKQSGGDNFVFRRRTYARLTIPNASGAFVYGINPAGNAVVGNYTPSLGITAGFLYQNKTLTTLQFPGSNTTYAHDINAAGEVVGYFFDASGNFHGFTWTPPGDAANK